MIRLVTICAALIALSAAQFNTNQAVNRSVIVHLFEWKWKDIAIECENVLSYYGYGGVQISPPNENLVMEGRPWFERYQPVSYLIDTRSGNEKDFLDMTRRCNAVGVRIYADTVINHMTSGRGLGTAGSVSNPDAPLFPAVPYDSRDFNNRHCQSIDYNNKESIRNCELVGLADLNQGSSNVRDKIVAYMNHLIDLGVAGFRIDATKHMWPGDLEAIYNKLKDLDTSFGFPRNTKPFIYQEVIDYGGDIISSYEYSPYGVVTEFKFSREIGMHFKGLDNKQLKWLRTLGPDWGFLPSEKALTFIDNHDNQRDGNANILNYKQSREYKMATAFHLAWPYGIPQVMSSYAFEKFNDGPPHDDHFNILTPEMNGDGTCKNGFVCEHRWRQIANMVRFRNAVQGTNVDNWWDNGNNQIAFSRGNRGFIVFNGEFNGALDVELFTNLPMGTYCDVISGQKCGPLCSGKWIDVDMHGKARFKLQPGELSEGVIAIYVEQKL